MRRGWRIRCSADLRRLAPFGPFLGLVFHGLTILQGTEPLTLDDGRYSHLCALESPGQNGAQIPTA